MYDRALCRIRKDWGFALAVVRLRLQLIHCQPDKGPGTPGNYRHGLIYYRLDRSGSVINASVIRFGDTEFEANLPIASFLDVSSITASYRYSLLFDEKREVAIGMGLTVMDIQSGFIGSGNSGVLETDTAPAAPLPTVSITGGYALTDKMYIRAGAGIFSFDLALCDENDIRGSIATYNVGLYHNTFKNFRFGLTYSYYNVDVEWGNTSATFRPPVIDCTPCSAPSCWNRVMACCGRTHPQTQKAS